MWIDGERERESHTSELCPLGKLEMSNLVLKSLGLNFTPKRMRTFGKMVDSRLGAVTV
jgi:hypothetical protein